MDVEQKFSLPDWIGAEVTADPKYDRKINMVAARLGNTVFSSSS
jgi:CYTH domain-containing protein